MFPGTKQIYVQRKKYVVSLITRARKVSRLVHDGRCHLYYVHVGLIMQFLFKPFSDRVQDSSRRQHVLKYNQD